MPDAPKSRTVEITNNDQGPRYVHAVSGMFVLPAGETATVEMLDAEIDSAKGSVIAMTKDAPVFTISSSDGEPEGPSDQGEALSGLPVAKLRQIANAEGVQLTDRKDTDGGDLPDITAKGDIVTAIEARRAADNGHG